MWELETYSLTNFIPFSWQTYVRLFERWNESAWPGQIPLLIAVVAAAAATSSRWHRWARLGFGLSFLGPAAFLATAYADLVWAGPYFAAAFGAQAVATAVWAWRADQPSACDVSVLAVLAILFAALWPRLSGLGWANAEVAGLTPDATCATALVIVAGSEERSSWLLMPVPATWLAVSAATWWALDDPGGLVVPAFGFVLAIGYLLRRAIW